VNSSKGTYVVCLDCGQEFAYNWQDMKVGDAVSPIVAATRPESFVAVNR
jgi:hypothetical protein